MKKTTQYFSRYRLSEKDAYNPTSWWMYVVSRRQAEASAHRSINSEIPKNHDSLEWKLATSCAEISDHYRFNDPNRSIYDIYANMLANYQTFVPLILFRGASAIPYEQMVKSAQELGDPNIDLYEKGFMSCSLLPEYASSFTGYKQFVIFVRPLSNVMYVGHLADGYSQFSYECIVQKGSQLKIVAESEQYIYCVLEKHYKKNDADDCSK